MDADARSAPWPFLADGGAMGALMRAHDWRASPLGSPETWPQSLRTMVAACLNSPILTTVLWGPDLRMLYNDGYIPSLADRHPRALGEPVAAVWGSAWDVVAPKFHSVLETGRGVSDSNVRLVIQRRGQTEETYWNFSVTPIRGEDGSIAGLLNMGTEITEQVRAERQLKAEREQFARLFEQAPTFMALLTGPDHRIELANPGYQQLIGHRPVLGRTVEEALPDAVQQGYLTLLDEVYGSGKAYSATGAKYAVQPVPGGPSVERFVDFVLQPIVDAAGQVTGVFVEGVDVTARALADAALSRGEARNRQILDSAIDYAIVATDLDGRVTRWNEGARRILGWTETEMLGQTTARFFTPEDIARGRMQTEMLSALETGRGMDEHWHIRRNGERFWSLGEMTALKEEDGTIVGFVKVLRDRTEQRLAQEAKRLSEVRLASALEIAQLGTFDWNMVTGEIGLCDRSREIFGFGETERLREGDLLRRINPAEASRVARQVEQALASQQRLETEYSIVLPDGTVRYVLSIGDPIVTESGNVEGMFGVFGDITDRKRSEAALLELNETLERRIAAALAEREAVEEALRQSQKMEAVGQLTGGLAHDFNNLLTGITGSLELLQTRVSQGRTKDVNRYVEAAQGAAKRAAALTHRLLAFSRRQTLEPKSTDMNRLVDGMVELVRRTVGPEIAVRTEAADGLWNTLVDPSQLENALLNLCINARDAMPDGGALTIATRNLQLGWQEARARDLPPGQYVSLCVSDTGTGMPPDVVARAFDPFFTTKPLGQGTGLGLSMIYGFARQSGGQVRIASAVGQGTQVSLDLPRNLGVAAEARALAAPSHVPRAGQDEAVLVVDDEPSVRMLVVDVLEDLGYRAIEAADGAAGQTILNSAARIDLLVTDVGLPGGMNGRQLADAARVARPELKVLFITGYAEHAVLSHGDLDPGMHVLVKPFAIDVLAWRIKELIAGGS